MKRFHVYCFLTIFVLSLTSGLVAYRQYEEIKKGEVVVLFPDKGPLKGGPVFILKKARKIVDKTSIFPVILWEDQSGKVYAQHSMIAGSAYLAPNLAATAEEEALFRTYFPV